jgi:hypothetical protein
MGLLFFKGPSSVIQSPVVGFDLAMDNLSRRHWPFLAALYPEALACASLMYFPDFVFPYQRVPR